MLLQSRVHRWRNVAGTYTLDVYGDYVGTNRYQWFEAATDRPLTPELAALAWQFTDGLPDGQPFNECSFVVHFRSSGYYDPGRHGSCLDDCCPPEGEETRTCDYIEMVAGEHRMRLKPMLTAVVWNCVVDAVDEVVIDYEQD